jgi:phage gpG-like protein
MTTINIDIQGLSRLHSGLSQVERGLTSLRSLWDRFAKEFYSEEKKLFAAAPWKPLTPAYEKRKRAKYGDKPILQATGRLLGSLTEQGAEGNVHRVDDQSAEFGSAVPYGVFHHESRPPLAEPDEDRYGTLAGEYVAGIAKAAGFA